MTTPRRLRPLVPPAATLLAIILSATLLLLASPAAAQFGVPQGAKSTSATAGAAEAGALDGKGSGNNVYGHVDDDSSSAASSGFLSPEDAADMEALIDQARADPETMHMVHKMKGDMGGEIAELRKLSQEEVLGGMKRTLDDLKLIEYLFKDKDRALVEMEKEGMIDRRKLKAYRKDPDLLEEDTRKGLYFQFVSLAVVGGFL